MMDIYETQFQAAAARLATVIPQEKPRWWTARILVLASSYGAGDALAGLLLRDVPREALARVAELLSIPWQPPSGGMNQAMRLLEKGALSTVPEVRDLLAEMDRGAVAGTGWRQVDAP